MKCPECHCDPPGHKINCKTGNDRAAKYQASLKRRRPAPSSREPDFEEIDAIIARCGDSKLSILIHAAADTLRERRALKALRHAVDMALACERQCADATENTQGQPRVAAPTES